MTDTKPAEWDWLASSRRRRRGIEFRIGARELAALREERVKRQQPDKHALAHAGRGDK